MLKHGLLGLMPGVSDPTSPGQGLETALSNAFPGNTVAARSRATLWERVLEDRGQQTVAHGPNLACHLFSFLFFFFLTKFHWNTITLIYLHIIYGGKSGRGEGSQLWATEAPYRGAVLVPGLEHNPQNHIWSGASNFLTCFCRQFHKNC